MVVLVFKDESCGNVTDVTLPHKNYRDQYLQLQRHSRFFPKQ